MPPKGAGVPKDDGFPCWFPPRPLLDWFPPPPNGEGLEANPPGALKGEALGAEPPLVAPKGDGLGAFIGAPKGDAFEAGPGPPKGGGAGAPPGPPKGDGAGADPPKGDGAGALGPPKGDGAGAAPPNGDGAGAEPPKPLLFAETPKPPPCCALLDAPNPFIIPPLLAAAGAPNGLGLFAAPKGVAGAGAPPKGLLEAIPPALLPNGKASSIELALFCALGWIPPPPNGLLLFAVVLDPPPNGFDAVVLAPPSPPPVVS